MPADLTASIVGTTEAMQLVVQSQTAMQVRLEAQETMLAAIMAAVVKQPEGSLEERMAKLGKPDEGMD